MSEEATSPVSAPKRDSSFDVLKGILILLVVLLHSTGRSSARLAIENSTSWWILKYINWALCFAVPTFIFASAVLWTRSQVARGNWDGYFGRRIKSILIPYGIWTVLYWLFKLVISHNLLTQDTTRSFIDRLDVKKRLYELFFGKAEFHLYFMFVMLQLAIIFPIIYLLSKRVRINSIWAMCAIALVVQYAVFFIYRALYSPLYGLIVFRSPSSYVLWYQTSLIPGIWLGLNWSKWAPNRKALSIVSTIVAIPLIIEVIILETTRLQKADVSSYVYNGCIAALALAMSMVCLAVSQWLSTKKVGTWLTYVGQKSIQIYFVHPMIMFFMDGRRPIAVLKALPGAPLWAFVILVALSLGFATLVELAKLDGFLFGRSEAPKPKPSAVS